MNPALKPSLAQEVGAAWLASRRYGLLADEMRVGKTVQAINAAAKVRARRILVVCPANAVQVWVGHFEADDRDWGYISGSDAPDTTLSQQVYVASYTEVVRHFARHRGPWDLLIIDEAHYAKTPTAKRTQAIYGSRGLVWRAERWWALTGTPQPNHAGELWVYLYVAGQTSLGYEAFCERYCILGADGRPRRTNPRMAQELNGLLEPVMLRRLRRDVIPDEPEVRVSTLTVAPCDDVLPVVEPVLGHRVGLVNRARLAERELFAAVAGLPIEAQADYMEAHQEHFAAVRRLGSLLKVRGLADVILRELEIGLYDKFVVFGYHRQALVLLEILMREEGVACELMLGGTSAGRKRGAEARFKVPVSRGGPAGFIGQILSAGTAIDLSVAHQGFMLELDWVPGNNEQAMMRLSGWRQDRPVHFRVVHVEGSTDSVVTRAVLSKAKVTRAVLGG